jgi:signal transduction histidine kinase/CheY-like chemotaxis protein
VGENSNRETRGDLLQVVLDSLTYPFYVIDVSDYHIRLANLAARRMRASDASTCHALTHHLDVPCHTEDHPCPLEIIRQTGRPTIVEHVHYDEKGSPRNMEVHAFPIFDEAGRLVQIIEYCVDITERKQSEQILHKVQERVRQLQEMTLELSQAEDRERKRLAEILHDDLQQMLAAAKFNIGLLGNRAKHGLDVQDMARQVKDLLAQAIDGSRSLSHELSPPVLGQSDLCETFEWLAEQIQTKHGLTVHVEVRDPVVVHSEPLKGFLFKAAQELLFNVIKHARVKEARLRLRHRRGYIFLSVADKGTGFDPQNLDKRGFGLMSIRERVQLLGGTMKIRSIPGKGSVFLIKVSDPATKTTAETQWTGEPPAAKTAAQRKRAEREGEAGLRILLVDDHKIVREGIEAMLLEEQDIQVVGQAGNGREAVELAHRLEPDVIVMDVSMPVMPGDEATRRIKRALPQIRVIALSMFDDARTADRMRKAGATAYLLKTAPSEQLLAAIRGSESPTPAASSA